MRFFKVNDVEKWMHQNKAEHTGAFFEGCLLDNYVLACKRGFCAVYERYVNPNMSEHIYEFAPYKHPRECKELWDDFYEAAVAHGEWIDEINDQYFGKEAA